MTAVSTPATPGTDDFARDWVDWHRRHEAVRADLVLDFNRAVNLPCAYTDFATCPLPPAENRLPVASEAGEQIAHGRRA